MGKALPLLWNINVWKALGWLGVFVFSESTSTVESNFFFEFGLLVSLEFSELLSPDPEEFVKDRTITGSIFVGKEELFEDRGFEPAAPCKRLDASDGGKDCAKG